MNVTVDLKYCMYKNLILNTPLFCQSYCFDTVFKVEQYLKLHVNERYTCSKVLFTYNNVILNTPLFCQSYCFDKSSTPGSFLYHALVNVLPEILSTFETINDNYYN